jgi:hypothetical protein
MKITNFAFLKSLKKGVGSGAELDRDPKLVSVPEPYPDPLVSSTDPQYLESRYIRFLKKLNFVHIYGGTMLLTRF